MSRDTVVPLLLEELAGRGRCLDVGVGTGEMAIAVARGGVPLAAVDISPLALARLVANAGGIPFPLVVADAVHLPFAGASFGGAIGSLVFHLIPLWPLAVAELVRVVRPGGTVLVALVGGAADAMAAMGERYVSSASGRDLPVGVGDPEELDGAFKEAGASVRVLPPEIEESSVSPQQIIEHLERGQRARLRSLDEDALQAAVEAMRAWARIQFGSLDRPIVRQRTILWRAYDLGG